MITLEQEKWLAQLNDSDNVRIFPVDLKAGEKFEKIKKQIQAVLGEEIKVVHRGATSLGISGQGELDVYIPTQIENFDLLIGLVQGKRGQEPLIY